MSDMMTFPATVEEFMEQYKIVDTKKIYTNGTELVPIFRMVQWFEHVSATDKNVGTIVSRQKAIDVLKELTANGTNKGMISGEDAVHRIEMLPPAQPEIIRCKDCKYAHITYGGEVKYCDIWFPNESHYIDTDNYCSFAERRTDG